MSGSETFDIPYVRYSLWYVIKLSNLRLKWRSTGIVYGYDPKPNAKYRH